MKNSKPFTYLVAFLLSFGWSAPSLSSAEAEFEEVGGYPLSKEKLAFGEEQVRQMLKDRPAMAAYAHPGDRLWNWASRQFAGQFVEAGVSWNPRPPDWNAEFHYDAVEGKPDKGEIAVRSDWMGADVGGGPTPRSGLKPGDVLWLEAAFELYNIRNYMRYLGVVQLRAQCGQSTKDSFVVESALVEWDIQGKMKKFHDGLWIGHCKGYGMPYQSQFNDVDNFVVQDPADVANHILTKKGRHPYYVQRSKYYDGLKKITGTPCVKVETEHR